MFRSARLPPSLFPFFTSNQGTRVRATPPASIPNLKIGKVPPTREDRSLSLSAHRPARRHGNVGPSPLKMLNRVVHFKTLGTFLKSALRFAPSFPCCRAAFHIIMNQISALLAFHCNSFLILRVPDEICHLFVPRHSLSVLCQR